MRALLKVALLTIGVAALIAGCGDGGEDSGPSKAVFIKRAEAACLKPREDVFERVGEYEAKHRSDGLSKTALSTAAVKTAVLEVTEDEYAALRKLEAPAGEDKEVEAILAAVGAGVEKAQQPSTKTSSDVEDAFSTADKKLRAYGLDECVKGG
jgi:hypothetical protein